jgi:hypothetical protein
MSLNTTRIIPLRLTRTTRHACHVRLVTFGFACGYACHVQLLESAVDRASRLRRSASLVITFGFACGYACFLLCSSLVTWVFDPFFCRWFSRKLRQPFRICTKYPIDVLRLIIVAADHRLVTVSRITAQEHRSAHHVRWPRLVTRAGLRWFVGAGLLVLACACLCLSALLAWRRLARHLRACLSLVACDVRVLLVININTTLGSQVGRKQTSKTCCVTWRFAIMLDIIASGKHYM